MNNSWKKVISIVLAFIALSILFYGISEKRKHSKPELVKSPDGQLEVVTPESVGIDSRRLSRIDSIVNVNIEQKNIPGAVVCVVHDGKIPFLRAYGNKALVPEIDFMTTETVFDLASVSKCVGTTISFMQLIEKGYVRLTDKVKRYIPDFKPWVDPKTGEKVDIRIRDLMTHASGIDPYVDVNACVNEFGENQPDSLMRYIATRTGRNFKPGTDYMYSCLNFVTLQNILQKVTGEKLCDYAQKNVFDVLGLKHTSYHPIPEECAPTELQEDGLPLVGVVHDPLARRLNGGNSGNAGVFSNAEDLAVICAAIMNNGTFKGKRILSRASVSLMSKIPPENAPEIGRGLGWDVNSVYSGLKGDFFTKGIFFSYPMCHSGYTGTSILIDLSTNTALIILTNRVHPYDKGSVSRLRATIANVVISSVDTYREEY